MSQAGYTPIQMYYSTTAAAAPSAGNLAAGELAVNITDGKLFYKDNGGVVRVLASAAGASGDVAGPGSSTDNALVRFDGTTGKLVQNSVGVLSDAGVLTGLTGLTSSGNVTLSSLTSGRVPYASTGGLLVDSANLLYSGTDLTVYGLTVGRGAGAVSTNTAVGASALAANTTGTHNNAFGTSALASNTEGGANVAMGWLALYANTTGGEHVALGHAALASNTTGARNVAIGHTALNQNTTASANTAVGYQAGYNSNGTFGGNSFFGYQSGLNSSTAYGNAFFGDSSGLSTTTGISNVAVGGSALRSNTTASFNTAVGYQAGYSLSGSTGYITAIGRQAAYSTTTGIGITAVGSNTLFNNTTGQSNVAVGGTNGVTLGSALEANTTGSYNTAIGHAALCTNTTASFNTAMGYKAGYSNQAGTYNTFIGYEAGRDSAFSGNGGNTCIGASAGALLTTGQYNTFIGPQGQINNGSGGLITTGSKNTILGGYNGNQGGLDIRTASNNIVLSDGDGNPRFYDRNGTTYSPSIYNIATSGGSTVSIGSDASMFRNTSSLRYKKNVVDTSRGLSDVMKLRAVQYESIAPQEAGKVFGGLIAEELHDSGLTEFVEYNSEGQPDAVHYANMVSLAFKAIQELKAEFDAYKATHP